MEMRLLLLPLRCIVHRVRLTRLIQQRLSLLFAKLCLLVLLREITRSAAASAKAILAAVAGQIVLCAHVAAIDKGQDPSKANAGQTSEGGTLGCVSI